MARALEVPNEPWSIELDTAVADGKVTVTLRRFATAVADDTGLLPPLPVGPILVIRCREGKTEVFVTVLKELDTGLRLKGVPVAIGFDTLAPVTERWLASDAGDAVFSRGPDAFLAQLTQADTVHVRVSLHDSVSQSSSFAAVGLPQPLRQLAPECRHANWPVSPTTIN